MQSKDDIIYSKCKLKWNFFNFYVWLRTIISVHLRAVLKRLLFSVFVSKIRNTKLLDDDVDSFI